MNKSMYKFCTESEEFANEIINKLCSLQDGYTVWSRSLLLSCPDRESSVLSSAEGRTVLSQVPYAPIDIDTPDKLTQLSNTRTSKRQLSEDEAEVDTNHKRIKLDENLSSSATADEEPTQLPQDILEQCLRVRESLLTEHDVNTDDLAVFLCPPHQIEAVCSTVELQELPEKYLSSACHNIISMASSISYTNSLVFLRHAVLPKILLLSTSGSRLLLTTLTELCEHFPHQVLETVLVPCITSQLENHQGDLLVKCIKSSINDSLRNQLLSKCTEKCYDLNESSIAVYQVLFDLKGNLSDIVLHQITELLSHNGVKHSKNLKFGKLLMAVITKYGKQINIKDLGVLQHTVDTHKSYLQKPLKAALKKLQSN